MAKITGETVRADFDDLPAVLYYTRAAHELGLWTSERKLIERFFTDPSAPLIEAGCGAGRVTLGLWSLGYRNLTAFDFARELVDQAQSLADERGASDLRLRHADATRLLEDEAAWRAPNGEYFRGALFLFNGLMQIPGRTRRRRALAGLAAVCAPAAPLLFTTHDRDVSPTEQALWRLERLRWDRGEQDPRLVEFGTAISRMKPDGPSCICPIGRRFSPTWLRPVGSTPSTPSGRRWRANRKRCGSFRTNADSGARIVPRSCPRRPSTTRGQRSGRWTSKRSVRRT
jgi:SAM-dependent methyltransferase